MTKPGRISRAVALASSLVACGGDDPPADADGAGDEVAIYPALPADGSFSTGLSPERSLASLQPAELRAVCETTSHAVPLLASCPSWGLLAAYDLAFDPSYDDGGALPSNVRLHDVCSSTLRQCEAAYTAPPPAHCDLGFRAGCSGSVAQLETCFNDTLAATRTLLAATPACEALSCATFPQMAQQWLEDTDTYTASLKSCAELYDTCADAAGMEYLAPGETPRVADVALKCAD